MDYEKAYKDALEAAKKIIEYYKEHDRGDEASIEDLEGIFPELKESEDELTWLTKYIEEEAYSLSIDIRDNEDRIKLKNLQKALAWLEKQAERKTPQWMIDFLDNYRRMIGCSLDYDEARDVDGKILCIKDWLEKQGEKPQGKTALEAINEEKVDNANKVEPKFKMEKGKWYVCDTSRYTDFIVGKAYYCPKNGMLKPDENEIARYVARDCFHLWTIQDARDGDVLQLGGVTAIFKKYIGYENCECYCSVCNGEFEIPSQKGDDNIYGCYKVTPATKEQRDLLFRKMKEAGYEWDAEKTDNGKDNDKERTN